MFDKITILPEEDGYVAKIEKGTDVYYIRGTFSDVIVKILTHPLFGYKVKKI